MRENLSTRVRPVGDFRKTVQNSAYISRISRKLLLRERICTDVGTAVRGINMMIICKKFIAISLRVSILLGVEICHFSLTSPVALTRG